MIVLSISIVIALLITIGLPILAGVWLNRRKGLSWRVIIYGVMAYLIVQILVTLLLNGFSTLIQNQVITLSDQSLENVQIFLSVFLGILLGILVRWAGMKFLKEGLTTLESAIGIGLGYGGIESIMLVGLPLLTTFITMLSNITIDPETTTLDPAIVTQIEELWQVSFLVPLAGSLERIASFVMHITVTVLILQVFRRNKPLWLGAAFGVELLVTGLVVGLSEMGVDYGWVILVSLILMAGNLFLLYKLDAFDFIHSKKAIG